MAAPAFGCHYNKEGGEATLASANIWATAVAHGDRPVATPGFAGRTQARVFQPGASKNAAKKLTTEDLQLLQAEAARAEAKKQRERNDKFQRRNAAGVTVARSSSKDKTSENSAAISTAMTEGSAKALSSQSPAQKESVRRRSPEAKLDLKSSDKAPEGKASNCNVSETKHKPSPLAKSLSTRQMSPLSPKVARPQVSARASTPGVQSSRSVSAVSAPCSRSQSSGPAVAKVVVAKAAPPKESGVLRCSSPRVATQRGTPQLGGANRAANVRASTPRQGSRSGTRSNLTKSANNGVSKTSSTAVDSKETVLAAQSDGVVDGVVIDKADELPDAQGLCAEDKVSSTDAPPAHVTPREALQVEMPQVEVSAMEALPTEVPLMETPTSEENSPNIEIRSVEGRLADVSDAEVLEADVSAEVLDVELIPKIGTTSDETPALVADMQLDQVQMAKLYVHRLIARTLGA